MDDEQFAQFKLSQDSKAVNVEDGKQDTNSEVKNAVNIKKSGKKEEYNKSLKKSDDEAKKNPVDRKVGNMENINVSEEKSKIDRKQLETAKETAKIKRPMPEKCPRKRKPDETLYRDHLENSLATWNKNNRDHQKQLIVLKEVKHIREITYQRLRFEKGNEKDVEFVPLLINFFISRFKCIEHDYNDKTNSFQQLSHHIKYAVMNFIISFSLITFLNTSSATSRILGSLP